jgi:hypothetical protein
MTSTLLLANTFMIAYMNITKCQTGSHLRMPPYNSPSACSFTLFSRQ